VRSLLSILLGVVVALVLIAVPLFLVVRAECGRGEREEYDWFLTPPLGEIRRDCRNPKTGAQQVLEFVQER
jgi:hypothetical protein